MRLLRGFALMMLLLVGRQAFAAQTAEEGTPFYVAVHAFVSQGFMVSTDNNYLTRSSEGSFEFTEAGINFTRPLTDRLRMGIQLFTRKLGAIGNYGIKADWFYLDYRPRDWFGIRAGRVKLPFGLYNDTSDIDSARVFVLLPQSVYPTENRDFLLAQTGVEVYGYVNLRTVGALDYRLYAGTIFLDITNTPGSPFQVIDLTTRYLVGGRLLWETPLEGLRLGGSLQALRLDTDFLVTMPPSTVQVRIPAVLWVASFEYARNRLLVAAEYGRWYVDEESANPMFVSPTVISERAYGLATYRIRRWLEPGLYYSILFPNVSQRSGKENQQQDLAATVRFDINQYWLIKLEAHYLHGTGVLNSVLNNNTTRPMLEGDWALFLVKTTAYF